MAAPRNWETENFDLKFVKNGSYDTCNFDTNFSGV